VCVCVKSMMNSIGKKVSRLLLSKPLGATWPCYLHVQRLESAERGWRRAGPVTQSHVTVCFRLRQLGLRLRIKSYQSRQTCSTERGDIDQLRPMLKQAQNTVSLKHDLLFQAIECSCAIYRPTSPAFSLLGRNAIEISLA